MRKLKLIFLLAALSLLIYFSMNSNPANPASLISPGKVKKDTLFSSQGLKEYVKGISPLTEKYTRNDGTEVIISGYFRSKLSERYFTAVINSLTGLEKRLGKFPLDEITIVELPQMNKTGEKAFPGGFAIRRNLINYDDIHTIERKCAFFTAMQYFLKSDEPLWIIKGLSAYYSDKITNYYYGEESHYFFLSDYYPVFGYNLISYHGIPLVYTLGDYKYGEGTTFLPDYYKRLRYGSPGDTSTISSDIITKRVNTINKPALLFGTLSNLKGEGFIDGIVNDYLAEPGTEKDFPEILKLKLGADSTLFFKNFVNTNKIFDYGISAIKETGNNAYEIKLERFNDGVFPQQIRIITENDTLFYKWDGEEKIKLLKIETGLPVVSAEIDPGQKNMFDINFANNSFTVESRMSATVSISARWFFWMQNLLMYSGSAG